jgi:DNA-binding LytR/AlgR family response regulator
MTAHHLWLPVRNPVHQFDVVPYETQQLPGLAYYLPALLTLGALAGAGLYFSVGAWSDRLDRGALILAAIAGSATLQLLIEVSRAFVAYTYPWHLARVAAIAILAALTATLIAAYAAHRLVPGRARAAIAVTALASLASLLLVPGYDLKALAAIIVGALALGSCGVGGRKRHRREAAGAIIAAILIVAVMAFQWTLFLDRSWFMVLALLLVLLAAQQAGEVRRARQERDLERRRSAALAERLSRGERLGEAIVTLKDGSRTHRVVESDILYVRAADDYCEATLCDGRTLLVTEGLARLLQRLPPRFQRVHKSYAVNRSHVLSLAPRPGGGKLLKLSNGEQIPVGRSYGVAGLTWQPSGAGG